MAASISAPRPRTFASTNRAQLETDFAFEGPVEHWTTPDPTVSVDTTTYHGGHAAIRIESASTYRWASSEISEEMAVDFSGSTIELRAYVRTEDVHGAARLFVSAADDTGVLQRASSPAQGVSGTTEWTEVSVQLPLTKFATKLTWGGTLDGRGKAWFDDLQLLVDGKPVWNAPYREPLKYEVDRDHEFDAGSKLSITTLTPPQIENLAELGKVWGFLKYHHPKITSGEVHWDYELLRVLPTILAANDRATAEAAMLRWIDKLGPLPACTHCTTLDEKDIAVRPDLGWIDELGADLGARLHAIWAARVPEQQFYLSLVLDIGNPLLRHEPAYGELKLPDPGFQLLALFRLWNVIEYWAPDRELAENWQAALAKHIPTIMLAATDKDYKLALIAAIATVKDTHANLWSSLDVRPPEGACEVPASLRFIGKRAVVATAERETKLVRGDVITSIDGASVDDLVARWTPYYAASNEAARLRDIAWEMTRGPCGDIALGIERRGKSLRLTTKRSVPTSRKPQWHDLPGPAFRLLSREVAYLKLSAVKKADAAEYVKQATGTKGWIIDIRNYPSEFVVWKLGPLLVDATSPFVRFTQGDLSNPGAFHWTAPPSLEPAAPHYDGKIVVLVDETTQSSAEYTTMAFRASPRTTVIGSTTAGADGNVTKVPLPGGLSTMFSGLGIFYPDKRPTQIVGIVPDVTATPTIKGLRDGRDEVLEAGLRVILGKGTSTAKLRKIVTTARRQ